MDARLVLAEALWQSAGSGGTDKALPHYEAAAALAAAAGDTSKEAMVALGHGFALTQLRRLAAARDRLEHARKLAEIDGNAGAVQFVERLLQQTQSQEAAGPGDEAEATLATWRHFAEALATDKPAVLFMRGTLAAPLDEASLQGATKLRAAGCVGIEVVDVCDPGKDVPEGLQAISDSAHLRFPQLFVAGADVPGWLDLPPDALRQRLSEAGVALGEAPEEPCHGAAAFAEGLEAWEVALVELVSQDGAGQWASLAEKLRARIGADGERGGGLGPEAVEAAWQRLAPVVKQKLETQLEMPCGHSCSTCPTRHDCQLHDAVGGARDIEDLA